MTLQNSSSMEVQVPCDQAAARKVLRRVFHLIDSFNVGGTETQAVELARGLPAERYDVTVGCLKREGPVEGRLQGTGIAIREFRSRNGIDSPSGVCQLLHMSWFLRSFDIVHTHDLWSTSSEFRRQPWRRPFRCQQGACNSQRCRRRQVQVGPQRSYSPFPDAGDGKLVVLVGNMPTDVKGHPWVIAVGCDRA